MTRTRRTTASALTLALAAPFAGCAGDPTAEDPFDGTGDLEQAVGVSCAGLAYCPSGADTYSSVYRVGATSTSRGALLQFFTPDQAGSPASVRLRLRMLRPFGNAATRIHANILDLTSADGPFDDAAIGSAPVVAGATVKAATLVNGDVDFDFVAGDDAVVNAPLSVREYALHLYTDDVGAADGTLLVGVGALQTASYAGDALRRGQRLQPEPAGWGDARFRDAGGFDIAFGLGVSAQAGISVSVTGLVGTLGLLLDGTEALNVSADGTHAFTTGHAPGEAYVVTIASQPSGSSCSLGANASGTAGTTDVVVDVTCTVPVLFSNGQSGVYAIGQANLTSSTSGPANMWGPRGNAVFVNGKLFVADEVNNRILRYDGVPASSPGTPDGVIGQASLATNGSGSGLNQLYRPWGIATDGVKLAVTDRWNSRVLIYDLETMPAMGATAEVSIAGTNCTASQMVSPAGIVFAGGKMLVSDNQQGRVLVWNARPTTNNAPASFVLGRSSLTDCSNTTSPTQANMKYPGGLAFDGQRLYALDAGFNRVIVWNALPTASGALPDLVVGQPDFTSSLTTMNASVLHNPLAVGVQNGQLFVADTGANRLLIWNSLPSTSGVAADRVLGQPNFTTSTSPSSPSASVLSAPTGILLTGTQLIVSDSAFNRVLVFQGI